MGIVTELQKDLLNNDIVLSNCLMKAYYIAEKLEIKTFSDWLENEMNGYPNGTEVPEYRKIKGMTKVHHIYQGWRSIVFKDIEYEDFMSTSSNEQSILALEEILKAKDNVNILTTIPSSYLNQSVYPGCDNIAVFFDKSTIQKIITNVRNKILKWTLELQKEGVEGEGLSFTSTEKEKAMSNQSINIKNVENLSMLNNSPNSSQIQNINKNIDLETLNKFVSELSKYKDLLELSDEKQTELEEKIETLQSLINNQEVRSSIITPLFTSIKSILEGAAGSVVASGLLQQLPFN